MKRISKTSLLILLLINCLGLTLKGAIIDSPVSKKKHHHKHHAQGVNNTLSSTGAVDFTNNPVDRQADAINAQLYKEQLYKPGSTNLVRGRSININKADLDKYFPTGVDLSLSDAQIQTKIAELKEEGLYENIVMGAALLTLGGYACYYFLSRPPKRKLL